MNNMSTSRKPVVANFNKDLKFNSAQCAMYKMDDSFIGLPAEDWCDLSKLASNFISHLGTSIKFEKVSDTILFSLNSISLKKKSYVALHTYTIACLQFLKRADVQAQFKVIYDKKCVEAEIKQQQQANKRKGLRNAIFITSNELDTYKHDIEDDDENITDKSLRSKRLKKSDSLFDEEDDTPGIVLPSPSENNESSSVDDESSSVDDDYIFSELKDIEEPKKSQTDYLVGPGVTEFNLNIIDNPEEFSCFIVNDFNVSESFLVYREKAIEKANKGKNLTQQERLAINFIMNIDKNKPKPPYLTNAAWKLVLNDLAAEFPLEDLLICGLLFRELKLFIQLNQQKLVIWELLKYNSSLKI